MTIEQLTGRYFRLKQELEIAYRRTPWQAGHIDRLASDLATIEIELSQGRVHPSPLDHPPRDYPPPLVARSAAT